MRSETKIQNLFPSLFFDLFPYLGGLFLKIWEKEEGRKRKSPKGLLSFSDFCVFVLHPDFNQHHSHLEIQQQGRRDLEEPGDLGGGGAGRTWAAGSRLPGRSQRQTRGRHSVLERKERERDMSHRRHL